MHVLNRREAQGRLKVGQPIAIIDIGSNSVRLVAYEGLVRSAHADLQREGPLRPRPPCGDDRAARRRGGRTRPSGARPVPRALRDHERVATSSCSRPPRRATPPTARRFWQAASNACGQPIALLSGAEEARLSALGVLSGFYAPDGLVGDMGGGSLELVDVNRDRSARASPCRSADWRCRISAAAR